MTHPLPFHFRNIATLLLPQTHTHTHTHTHRFGPAITTQTTAHSISPVSIWHCLLRPILNLSTLAPRPGMLMWQCTTEEGGEQRARPSSNESQPKACSLGCLIFEPIGPHKHTNGPPPSYQVVEVKGFAPVERKIVVYHLHYNAQWLRQVKGLAAKR